MGEETRDSLEALVAKYARAKGISVEEARKEYLPILRRLFERKEEDIVGRLAPLAEGLVALGTATKDLDTDAAKYIQLLAGGQIQKALNPPSRDDPDVSETIKRIVPQIAALKAIDKAFEAAYPKTEEGKISPDVQALTDMVGQLTGTVAELVKAQQAQVSEGSLAERALTEIASLKGHLAKERETREKNVLLEKIEALEDQVRGLREMPPAAPPPPPPTPSGPNVNMELEKMKMEQEKWKLEHQWDIEKWKMEQELTDKREESKRRMITKLVSPVVKKAKPIIDAAVREGEKKIRGEGATPVTGETKGSVFTCPKCGFGISVEGFPDAVTCPQCHTQYRKGE